MKKMPYTSKWQQILTEFYDIPRSKELASKAQAYYDMFRSDYAGSKYSNHQAVLNSRILPGLSIYKALYDENHNQVKVLNEVEILFKRTFFTNRLQGINLLNYLPNPFSIIKPILRLMTSKEYLPGSQETIIDDNDCFAINIYRCIILDVLIENNAKELTTIYCKTDDWLAQALPKISWERTKTLGRGDDCCDFRWCRIQKSAPNEGIYCPTEVSETSNSTE
ncbi:MAG: L-2-amino-thiazoline-4-carboxylic acid hydrolase [Chloroflexi bacterium]|nr:L-2-amino-thiazoline-4-carboxylic acid hydrolase [Chloroflexota bacterium]